MQLFLCMGLSPSKSVNHSVTVNFFRKKYFIHLNQTSNISISLSIKVVASTFHNFHLRGFLYLCREAPVAVWALEGALLGVRPHVDLQPAGAPEYLRYEL